MTEPVGLGIRAEELGRLRLRLRRTSELPLVALRVLLRGGARVERWPGETLLAGRLLSEGSGGRDHRQVAQEAEGLGMSLGGYGTYESLGVSIEALAEDVDRAIDWLAEMLLEPTFSEERVVWARRQAIGELRSQADQPEVVANRAFLRQLYGDHAYARPLQGDPVALEGRTSEDCQAAHRRAIGSDGLLGVTGQVDLDQVRRRLETSFGAAFEAPARRAQEPPAPLSGDPRVELVVPDPGQAHFFAGQLTIPRAHPDWWALAVAGVVLGAGPGLVGRLPDRIREQEGLAYHVDVVAAAGAGTDPGRFAVYVGTSPETVEAAERALREELDRALADGFTDVEVDEARSWLLGRRAFRRETVRGDLEATIQSAVYALPGDPDRSDDVAEGALRDLERVDVEAALRRWLRPDELRVTVGWPRPDQPEAET